MSFFDFTLLTRRTRIISGMFFLVILTTCLTLRAAEFPTGVFGLSYYDYFTEALPPGSRGIYTICEPNNRNKHRSSAADINRRLLSRHKDGIKYIGSAADINYRLSAHHKNGVLEMGDMIWAIVFHADVRQREILNYEKTLIERLKPSLNKHTGAPGRPWRSEQISKLQTFYEHNHPLLTLDAHKELRKLLNGNVTRENYKLAQSLFKVMRLFR